MNYLEYNNKSGSGLRGPESNGPRSPSEDSDAGFPFCSIETANEWDEMITE